MTDTRIMLASGTLFDLTDPEGSEFTLHDIAHGLGRVCRFAGQTNRFYSVAEHCFHVSRLVPLEHKRAALLHDAAEAFIGDVTRPLKALLPEYKVIEARIEEAIQRRFLGDLDGLIIHHPAIKAIDMAMCVAEARELMPNVEGYWSSMPVDPDAWRTVRDTRLNFDKPEYATSAWLRAWSKYSHWEEEAKTKGEPS